MKRCFVLCLLVWAGSGQAQIAFTLSSAERMNIEIVPVFVVSEETARAAMESPQGFSALEDTIKHHWLPQFSKMFVSAQNALYALGVTPDEYNLHLGDVAQFMICSEANVAVEQQCVHQELGLISDLPNFAYNLYDGKHPPLGTVQLSIMLLELDSLSRFHLYS